MKYLVLLMFFCSFSYGQTTLSAFIGTEIVTYKFKNYSDPHVVGAINVMNIDEKGWIKEGTFGYSTMNSADNLYVGIYLGKKYDKILLRSGARMIGLLNTESKTEIALCILAGYQMNKSLTLNIDYGWLPSNVSLHTFGINALVKLYGEKE